MPLVGRLLTALLTPFTLRGGIDMKRLRGLVAYQISKSVNGFFVCGSTGAFPLLSREERKMIAETVIEESERKVAVVVHVGFMDTQGTVELAKHAEKVGATAIACITPYYYRFGIESLVRHYRAVSKQVSIPTFVYNIPPNTSFNVTPPALVELSRRGGVAGIKDSSRDFTQLITYIDTLPDAFSVLTGTENHFYAALVHGAAGLVSVAANVFPEACVEVYRAFLRGERRRARALQMKLNRIRNGLPQPILPSMHEMLRIRGVEAGYPREPFLPLNSRQKEEARRLVATLYATGAR